MHKDKIICGTIDRIEELNSKIEKATEEGYSTIGISMASPGERYATEACVLLCKKSD